MTLEQQLEGLLFYKAIPFTKQALLKLFDCSEEELAAALQTLTKRLESSALRLVDTGSSVELVTAPELDPLIEAIRKDELRRDIGRAGAETLAIVLYRGPLSRADIDRVRGVNSSFILRNLLVRGLIEKDTDTKNTKYKASTELFNHLGISTLTDLPDFSSIMSALETFETDVAKDMNT